MCIDLHVICICDTLHEPNGHNIYETSLYSQNRHLIYEIELYNTIDGIYIYIYIYFTHIY